MSITILKFNNNILKRDLTNKSNIAQAQGKHPCLKSIVLSFKLPKSCDLKTCAKLSLALELITGAKQSAVNVSKKGRQSNFSSVSLKLEGKKKHLFLTYFILEVQPKIKEIALTKQDNLTKQLPLTVNSTEIYAFGELDFNRHIFSTLPNLEISFIFNKKLAYNEQRILCQLSHHS